MSVSEALATPDAGGPQQGCGQRFLRVLFFCCQITYKRNDLKTLSDRRSPAACSSLSRLYSRPEQTLLTFTCPSWKAGNHR